VKNPVPFIQIIAGRWKRRRLSIPDCARPTSGRAREALFSIVQKRVPGASVLDLYAGSGALGLEAVSRGAAGALLVDKDTRVLRGNLARLPPPRDDVEIASEEAGMAAEALKRAGRRFDLVFADPPYGAGIDVLRRRACALVARGGLFILQTDRGDEKPPEFDGLSLVERREYGRNVFLFFSADPSARPSKTSPQGEPRESAPL
jgi:16S rRNA (guanine966-N2)-methyltransferase